MRCVPLPMRYVTGEADGDPYAHVGSATSDRIYTPNNETGRPFTAIERPDISQPSRAPRSVVGRSFFRARLYPGQLLADVGRSVREANGDLFSRIAYACATSEAPVHRPHALVRLVAPVAPACLRPSGPVHLLASHNRSLVPDLSRLPFSGRLLVRRCTPLLRSIRPRTLYTRSRRPQGSCSFLPRPRRMSSSTDANADKTSALECEMPPRAIRSCACALSTRWSAAT